MSDEGEVPLGSLEVGGMTGEGGEVRFESLTGPGMTAD